VQTCAEGRLLKVAMILPGNLRKHGQSTDAQYLPVLTTYMQNICGKLGLGFHLDVHLSWECDDAGLSTVREQPITEPHHWADLQLYFPPRPGEERAAWERRCWDTMCQRQHVLLERANAILGRRNLIVVGSPKVNQVMANLCTLFLLNVDCLGQLGLYLVPSAGQLPMRLRRLGDGREWHERNWEDRGTGWVHLLRNPWAPADAPRFLIYLGGFYAQGTPAAMSKLVDICRMVAERLPAPKDPNRDVRLREMRQTLQEQRADYPAGNDPIPAHVVKARVEIPLNWFFETLRPGLGAAAPLWWVTPPAFEGSISGYDDV
jgi:hypothetical protein